MLIIKYISVAAMKLFYEIKDNSQLLFVTNRYIFQIFHKKVYSVFATFLLVSFQVNF